MNHGEFFVLAIIAMGIFGGTIKAAIRAKHGLPIEDRQTRRNNRRNGFVASDMEAERKVELLSAENEKLVGQIGRLEERLRVLERIATDPAERVAREIDELRTRD